jgi:hypothetical protein
LSKASEEDRRLIAEWIGAYMVRLVDGATDLREVVRQYTRANAKDLDEAEAMKRFFTERFACAMIHAAATMVVCDAPEDVTVGDLVGHFADHAFNARDEQERQPVTQLLTRLFETFEQEATHQMAKKYSEGN